MKLLSYLAFLACLEGLCFGVLAYWLNPRVLLNRLGAAIGLLTAWWDLCLMMVYGTPDMGTSLLFDRLSYLAILGLNPVLAWFFLTLADAPRRLVAGIVLSFAVVSAVVAAAYLIDGFPRTAFVPGPWGNVGVEVPRFWGTVSDVAVIALDLVYFAVVFRKRQTTTSWRLKRLLTAALAGIPAAIAGYLVLGWISDAFQIPRLTSLPAAVLLALNFYIIAQYRFLHNNTPRLDQNWAEILPQPVFLYDKQARIIGANTRARSLGAPLLVEFPPAWSQERAHPCEVQTPLGRVHLSPHFDRFGDFVGAVGIVQDRKLKEGEEGLSPRESEVLSMVAEGAGNQTIADRLFLSPDTVKRHVHSILSKTGAKTRRELVLRFGKLRV